jgi:hypothetical protein
VNAQRKQIAETDASYIVFNFVETPRKAKQSKYRSFEVSYMV